MKTNLAVLLDLLDIAPQCLSAAIGADTSLISRWRTGSRKLLAGRAWAERLADYCLTVDQKSDVPVIRRLLQALYPATRMGDPENLRLLLIQWLTSARQYSKNYQIYRTKLLGAAFSREAPFGEETAADMHVVASGMEEIHALMLGILDSLADASAPFEIFFECGGGLSILTRDEIFTGQLLPRLIQLFQRGSRMQVLVRTDFRPSDVAAFSGFWLALHLMGYVRSLYYDDFRKISEVAMVGIFDRQMGLRIALNDAGEIHAEFSNAPAFSDMLWESVQPYLGYASPHFHYDFFHQPGDVPPPPDANGVSDDCYMFTLLPHYGIQGPALLDSLPLQAEERERIRVQAWPLLISPEDQRIKKGVYHAFCIEEIERKLNLSRHRMDAFSAMCGRRIYMSTQSLIDNLAKMLRLLSAVENYYVYFWSERDTDWVALPIHMQLGVLGKAVAIGYIDLDHSAASSNYVSVSALNGFCATVWNRIPDADKSKAAAQRRLTAWLKRAEGCGFRVSW